MLQASRSWLFGAILRRSYSTFTAELAPAHRPRLLLPMISTLRPEKLMHSDFLVFSGNKRLSFHTKLSLHSPSSPAGKGQRGSTRLAYARRQDDAENDEKFVHIPFPEHAQGFLYLHQEPGLPRSDSSVRMRCTPLLVKASAAHVAPPEPGRMPTPRSEPVTFLPPSVSDTEIYEAFKAGYDLMHPKGLPWNVSVIFIASHPYLRYVHGQLLADGLFSESELLEYKVTYKSEKNKTRESLAAP